MSQKTIVLTGCTRGLGRALFHAWDAMGHTVFGCGRNETAVDELRTSVDDRHRIDAVDIADGGQVKKWSETVIDATGSPDFLVNNAGVVHRPAPFWEIPQKEVEDVFRVNVLGTSRVLKAFLPAMILRGRGMIVNLSSGAGRSGIGGIAAYASTKWAIEGLSKSVAAELPKGIGIVPLSPGMVDTDMLRFCYGTTAGNYRNPRQWAQAAAAFILSLTPEHNGQSLSTP
ncbi:MAG: SDR family oxidoreductase [Opitutales bacterium]|nr:SDR family oxidoreductase [Opitutales bacterium]